MEQLMHEKNEIEMYFILDFHFLLLELFKKSVMFFFFDKVIEILNNVFAIKSSHDKNDKISKIDEDIFL